VTLALVDTVPWDLRIDLFGLAMLAACLAGAVCPLVGCFLLVRRTSFYGIVLPQFAAAGIAFGFAILPWWSMHVGLGADLETALADSHEAMNYHIGWSSVFTFGALIALVLLSHRGGTEIGRVASAFAIASAATLLFINASPASDIYVTEMMRGEILVIGRHEFETLAATLTLVLGTFVLFKNDFLLISYDRDLAVVLGKRVFAFEALLMAMVGLTVAVSVMTVGPIVLFGLLVIPPLAARGFARSMRSFFLIAGALGLLSAVGGIETSFALDWPLGPSVVAVAALTLIPSWVASRLR
jgi:ABC-type Mn2+/Zn2+ transport system permease subunit